MDFLKQNAWLEHSPSLQEFKDHIIFFLINSGNFELISFIVPFI